MIPEEKLFISCLKDLCHGIATERPAELPDPELFCRMSDEQSLSGVIFNQCKGWLKNYPDFHTAFLETVAVSSNQRYLLHEISERFLEKGIPFICIKGSVYRDYWPEPALRSMGDIDILIRSEDRIESDRIMLSLGYDKMVDNQAVWSYWIGPFMFELHDHMIYEHLASQYDYGTYFDSVWVRYRKNHVFGFWSDNMFIPEDNLHFLYLIVHTAKHIINKGIGFRAFLDMVFYSRNKKLDWEWLEEELYRIQLLEFTRTCFALCENWFDVEMPLSTSTLDETFIETVTSKIFRDGTFGSENKENREADSTREIKKISGRYWKASLILTIHKIFPPYVDMQVVPWYSWLNGRPWLLPLAWIYRWGFCMINKRKQGVGLLIEPFTKRKIIIEREAFLEKWGL